MSQEQIIQETLKQYQEIPSKLLPYQTFIGEDRLGDLEREIKHFISDAKQDCDKDRLLRIGVIGQLKRGKSSFLNCLIFDGEERLPKAATPMTATLTKINYSEHPSAVIEYYSVNEWNSLKKLAQSHRDKLAYNQSLKLKKINPLVHQKEEPQKITDEERSASELVNMAQKNGLLVDEYLGKQEKIEGDQIDQLTKQFDQYVGADGHFTPIVKATALSLNLDLLKDIEIIDTPGLNDPITSRGDRTKEFMGKCDIIFFLSSSSQFLDDEDMGILTRNIPAKGIDQIEIVGTMFDSVLSEEGDHYSNFRSAIGSLAQLKRREKGERIAKISDPVIKKALSDKDTFLTSSIWYQIGKHFQNRNEEEEFYYQGLLNQFPEFDFNASNLMMLSQIDTTKKKLLTVKDHKEEILLDRFHNRALGFRRELRKRIDLIGDYLTHQQEQLISGDIEQLRVRNRETLKLITKAKTKINDLFESYFIDIEKKFSDLKFEIKSSRRGVSNIDVKEGSETHSYTERCGFLWLSTRRVYYTTHYRYASVYAAIETLREYVTQAESGIRNTVKELIDIKKFKKELVTNIEGVYNFRDDNFEPDDILIPVKNAVNRITIPDINIDVQKHIDIIRDNFSSDEVKDSAIDQLRSHQERVADLILTDLLKEVSSIIQNIIARLNRIQEDFIPGITRDIKGSIQKIEAQIKDKEKNIAIYQDALKTVDSLL